MTNSPTTQPPTDSAALAAGAKPEKVCQWAFELVGADPNDELHDLFPGTGAVSKAWQTWRSKFALPEDRVASRPIHPDGVLETGGTGGGR